MKFNNYKLFFSLISLTLLIIFHTASVNAQQNVGSIGINVSAGSGSFNEYIRCSVSSINGNSFCYFTNGLSNATFTVISYYIYTDSNNKTGAVIQGYGFLNVTNNPDGTPTHRRDWSNISILVRYDPVTLTETTFRVTARQSRVRRLLSYPTDTVKLISGTVSINVPPAP